ncbi:MAG: alkaline phosphatase family protein, partial [Clostridia bacterium]|nr:alkaline phosphatase family protein [Clostridia bacterium]
MVLVVVVSQLCTGENSKVLLYVADGMVPELVTKFISEGVMPNLAKIMDLGASAPHGITPPLPPNTGVSWPTIFTGAFAGSHGITNNSFHNVNDPINVSGWSWAGANRAESIVEAAEKDGLTAVVVGGPWPSWPPEMAGISGPVLTWEYWWTKPGVITNYAIPEAWMAPYLIVDYHQVDLGDAETCPIQSFSPPKSTTIEPSQYLGPAVWHWNVYVVDTTDDTLVNYDAVYLYDDDACLGILREGEWVYIPVEYEGKKGGV